MKASFFSEYCLYGLVRGFGAAVEALPVSWALGLGRGLGTLGYWLQPKRRALCLGNLTAALSATELGGSATSCGGGATPEALEAIARGVFQSMGMSFVELLRTPAVDAAYVDRWIRIVGQEHFDRAVAQGRGLILLTAHYGNWELASLTAGLKGYPVSVLVRQQGLPRLNRLLNAYRESKGCRVISKGMTVRTMIRELRRGGIVGILADQDAGARGVLAPFFGRLASTARGPIALALKVGCPVLPFFVLRTDGPSQTIVFEPPIALAAEGRTDEKIRAGVAAYLRLLERYVRRAPTHWLWPHRRWKSSPHQAVVALSDGRAGHRTQVDAVAQLVARAWDDRLRHDPRLAPPPLGGSAPQGGAASRGVPRPGAEGSSAVAPRGGGVAGESGPWMTCRTVEVRYRSAWHRGMLALAAATGAARVWPSSRWLRWALTAESAAALAKTWATVTVSCGAATGLVNLVWGRGLGARTVHVMRPPWPFADAFDLRIVPQHDLVDNDPRTVVTQGALHGVASADLAARTAEQRGRWSLACPTLIGVLIGGNSRGLRLSPQRIGIVADELLEAAKMVKGELLVTTSRRTPGTVENLLERRLDQHSRCPLLILANRDTTPGYVPGILAAANLLVVSGDSMSMVSEAVASGKPTLVFEPDYLWPWAKHRRFLAALAYQGAIQVVAPERLSREIIRRLHSDQEAAVVDDRAVVLARLARWL